MEGPGKKIKSGSISKKEYMEFENLINELNDLNNMLNMYADSDSFICTIQKDNPHMSKKEIWNRFVMLKNKIQYLRNKMKTGT